MKIRTFCNPVNINYQYQHYFNGRESADPAVATVDEHGYVTGVAPGETTVTLTSWNGVKRSATLNVQRVLKTVTLPAGLLAIDEEAFAGAAFEAKAVSASSTR